MNNAPLISAALIADLLSLARRAGAAIMVIYSARDEAGNHQFGIQQKSDLSPLTAADLAAHNLIAETLPQLLSLPIISEEGDVPDYAERSLWETYWLVDPLDGTKEFIAGTGEFTVNIALIHHGEPLLGVVHVPVTDTTYIGVCQAQDAAAVGAWKYSAGANPLPLRVGSLAVNLEQDVPFTALLSYRHATPATMAVMTRVAKNWPGRMNSLSAGSSLKFCLIAEGSADFYPRLAPTSEWDTAAAHAVLAAAGGRVVKVPELGETALLSLRYNTGAELINPHFYALGDANYDWERLLELPEE